MSNTITVRRANVLLDVPSEQQDEYLSKGFDVVDKKGKVIVEATQTNDVNVLKKKLAELQEENKVLKEQIKNLNEELDEIAAQDEEDGQEEKPSKRKSSK